VTVHQSFKSSSLLLML